VGSLLRLGGDPRKTAILWTGATRLFGEGEFRELLGKGTNFVKQVGGGRWWDVVLVQGGARKTKGGGGYLMWVGKRDWCLRKR